MKNSGSNIFTLVGLNESGKTTILEAINFFSHKPESLDGLGLESYEIGDIHDLIPINQRDNFNDSIIIEAGLELSNDEISEIKKRFWSKNEIKVSECSKLFTYSQVYHFKNSIHQKEEDESLWTFWAKGRKKRAQKERNLNNKENQTANLYIKTKIPSILYFPNFLFEFPERIYLDESIDEPKDQFYQNIIC